MIKISKMTDYAVLVLVEMSRDEERLSASSLSERVRLPEPTVSKILKTLAQAGLIRSVRGANGGYALPHAASGMRLSSIIEAMEGPIALTACVDGSHDKCSIEASCPIKGRWDPVNATIRAALENVTLAEMAGLDQNRQPRQGVA